MDKEKLNEDARNKQDLLYECSSLESKLITEVIKNKHLERKCKKQQEIIDKAVKYIDDLRDKSAERQGFYNCFPDDLYIPDINELLQILEDKEV